MSFKDLTTRAAALLKPKSAEPSKKEPEINAPDAGSKSSTPDSTKS
ncbi:hypothetical protein KX928_10710 [Roseobacter sp. YSTF-M11]|uniref:Uncharacterized protein n=1 Tax=Roseobacter insulae TaxID=2859783 RepID=A0A9X1JYK0_9RHOB|nr:hypothetical protein [Roseobacter insulae]MBW4708255.1 hypothetical protein [Roseobacter insulae]